MTVLKLEKKRIRQYYLLNGLQIDKTYKTDKKAQLLLLIPGNMCNISIQVLHIMNICTHNLFFVTHNRFQSQQSLFR